MLNLTSQHAALADVQQRFFDESLSDGVVRAAFAGFNPKKYGKEQLAWGREAWELRARVRTFLQIAQQQRATEEAYRKLRDLQAFRDEQRTLQRQV